MKKMRLIVIAAGFLFACAERKVATKTEEAPVAPPPQEVKTEPAKPQEETIKPSQTEKVDEVAKAMPQEAAAPAVKGDEVLRTDVHFDFDRYDIKEEDKPVLKKMADWMIASKDVRVVVEGHCDERGTSVYNLGLGERRANAARKYLVSLGVPSARIKTVSYGKEKPLCTESTEECWAKNRRGHFEVAEK